MAGQLLFGRLAHARRARPRRFRCFNAHLMHTVIFGLQGKLVENKSLSLLIISPPSLHSFWTFPRYASHRCTSHATMVTTLGNDRLITVHAPTTVSNIFFANSPTMFRFSKSFTCNRDFCTKRLSAHEQRVLYAWTSDEYIKSSRIFSGIEWIETSCIMEETVSK